MLHVKRKTHAALQFCTVIPIMHKLHVKIDNQAFSFIHVVEQVQLFKRTHSYRFSLRVRNRERGEGHSNETDNLDPARKLEGAAD